MFFCPILILFFRDQFKTKTVWERPGRFFSRCSFELFTSHILPLPNFRLFSIKFWIDAILVQDTMIVSLAWLILSSYSVLRGKPLLAWRSRAARITQSLPSRERVHNMSDSGPSENQAKQLNLCRLYSEISLFFWRHLAIAFRRQRAGKGSAGLHD